MLSACGLVSADVKMKKEMVNKRLMPKKIHKVMDITHLPFNESLSISFVHNHLH
jgi:hypothetical protein